MKKFESATFILLFAGLGCFLLSFIAMGLAPWTTLKHVTAAEKNSFMNPYVDDNKELNALGRGRKIYLKEGCFHCHSQFVRPVAGEPYRYGPPSQSFESMYDVPHSYGTRRVGPDLSRQAGRHSDDWHFAHLYNPRSVVPDSIMPGYPWYFENKDGTIVPKQEAKDLVAYLQGLGVKYKDEIQDIVYPKLFKVTGNPDASETLLERGKELFQQNCIGCHGQNGNGHGLALPFLQPKAANLVDRYISPSEAYSVLNRGVLGSAMPSFREMPEKDLWAIASYVSTLGNSVKETTKVEVNEKLISNGRTIYQTNCLACHGMSGEGDGPAAAVLNPRPKDFTRRVFAKAFLGEILKNGIPGSAMPAFSKISDENLDEISAYLNSLFVENK